MTKKKKKCWMAGVNLSGLWSRNPIRGYWYPSLEEYYDTSGNLSVCELGHDATNPLGLVTFASQDKKEVELWLAGANTVMGLLSRWTESD